MTARRTAAVLALACAACGAAPPQPDPPAFPLGVAAGDVTDEAALLWTRAGAPGTVRVVVAPRPDLSDPAFVAEVEARAEDDLTVRADVHGLQPATRYWYRFERVDDPRQVSRTGRFRTAPAPDKSAALRFAFSGDTDFNHAPFTLLADIAAQDVDLLIWYGDTVYADVPAAGLPAARTRDEYFARYRQLRSDPHLRDALAASAVWVGWDDHELANDYAGNDPALDRDRQRAAYEAFFAYQPVRPPDPQGEPLRIYRRWRWGREAEFFLLDGRQYRDPPADCAANPDPLGTFLPALADPDCRARLRRDRQMLGAAQFDWLLRALADSPARWKFVLNPVPMSVLGLVPYDRWDGYDAQRRALLEFIDRAEIPGVILLTTDIHAAAYNPDVTGYLRLWRPDSGLRARTAVPEVVAGPLGNAPLGQTVAALTGPLGPALTAALEDRIACLNGLDMVRTDRMNYVLVEVQPGAGAVRIRFRGLSPADGHTVQTFFETQVVPAPGTLPCCVPPVLAVAGTVPLWVCRRTRGAPPAQRVD